jgi:hypothetical protein
MGKTLDYDWGIIMGCDPEFFFKPKKGRFIVGAEKVISIKGLNVKSLHNTLVNSAVICDGVQGELNVAPSLCRAHVGNQIRECFTTLNKNLGDNVVDFRPLAKITKKELKSLSPQSKVFGCSPSNNAWELPPEIPIEDINPNEYRIRTAGGHIHIGAKDVTIHALLHGNIVKTIKMMDYLVGNTCVLLDRDISQIERRKTYGRAGEYRKQPWGLEYRTLSNFWLKSYQLMSFVLGLARETVSIVKQEHEEKFFKAVSVQDIILAINTNDFDLALYNFKQFIPIITELVPDSQEQFPLNGKDMDDFLWFVDKGIDYFFTTEPMKHWLNLKEGHGIGWENFIQYQVRPERTGIGIVEEIYK